MHLQFIPLYLLPSMHVCIHSFIVGSICIKLQTLFFMHQFNTGKLPKIFDSFFVKTSCKHNVNTRFASRSTFYLPKIRTNYGKFNIQFNGLKLFCFVFFVYLILYQVYDIYVYQCICRASLLTLTFLIIIITVTQVV